MFGGGGDLSELLITLDEYRGRQLLRERIEAMEEQYEEKV